MGLHATPYWAQVSTDPAFASAYSDSSWANTWTAGVTKSTNTGAFSGGNTVYVHVRSHDGFDQQSAWSANVSALCPIPVGTIKVRAIEADPRISCDDIRTLLTGGMANATFSFTGSSPSHSGQVPPAQIGSSYVEFDNAHLGEYTIEPPLLNPYLYARPCWIENTSGNPEGGDISAWLTANGATLTWDLVYTLGTAWAQVQGGDVYADATLKSYVPAPHPANVFITDDTIGGYPGVAMYEKA